MDKLPGVLVVIDVKREDNALKEARKLGIPTICLIDTDGDPELVDIPIPGNDDTMRSIDVVIRELCLAVAEGKHQRRQANAKPGGRTAPDPRRSRPSAAGGRRAARAAPSSGPRKPAAPTGPTGAEPAARASNRPVLARVGIDSRPHTRPRPAVFLCSSGDFEPLEIHAETS